MQGWIAVDLDGTLAEYHRWQGAAHIGAPVPRMVARVKAWLEDGLDVRIFSARVYTGDTVERLLEALEAERAIKAWCLEHIGQELVITCTKDFSMIELWDDRCVAIERNTGQRVVELPEIGLVATLAGIDVAQLQPVYDAIREAA